MLRSRSGRAVVVLGVLLLGVAFSCLGSRVFIERVAGYDAQLVNLAKPMLADWIEVSGNTLTTQRQSADYVVRFTITDVTTKRPFNWWVLLLPLWPIVPFTTVDADVIVAVSIWDSGGQEVLSDTAGGRASQWVFADFYSRDRIKRAAFQEAFKRVMVNVYLP